MQKDLNHVYLDILWFMDGIRKQIIILMGKRECCRGDIRFADVLMEKIW